MLDVLCGKCSVLLLLQWFIIFTAMWLKPNLKNVLKEFPLARARFFPSGHDEKDLLLISALMLSLLCNSKFYGLL